MAESTEDTPAPEPPEEELPEPIQLPDPGYYYITDSEGLAEAVDELRGSSVIGVDTESDSFFSYTERCCLLQITGEGTRDFVIDPLQVEDLSPLGPMFADPSIVKIFHGADYDVVSIKRDFGFTVRNIFDTMIAAQASAHRRFGLNDLVQRYFGEKLNKKWQRHDWSTRPLLPAHLDYARKDSHFLPVLRTLLMEQAEERGRTAMLAEEFELLEEREWTARPFNPDDCMRLKGSNGLDDEQRRVLRSLYVLREKLAEARNRPTFKVWGNDVLLKVAAQPPKDIAALRKVLGDGHHVVRRWSRDVLEAVDRGLSDSRPAPGPYRASSPKTSPGVPHFTRDDEPLLAQLKKWRNTQSKTLGLNPGMVVNNAVLREVAALKPAEVEGLERIQDMRDWQRQEFGAELVERVAEWLSKAPAGRKKNRRGRRRRNKQAEPGESSTSAPDSSD